MQKKCISDQKFHLSALFQHEHAEQKYKKIYCNFYAGKQILLSARFSHHNSVRLSIHLSHGWISQKRSKLGLPNLHHWLPGRL